MIQHQSAKPLTATVYHCLKNMATKGWNKPTEQGESQGDWKMRAFNAITQIKTNTVHVIPLIQEITFPFIIHGT
jgi:hypothetical protein